MMEETEKIALNSHGLRIKKCCASCIHKYVEEDGSRACPIIDEYVKSDHLCEHWAMDYNTSQAGVCRGRVHKKEYLMFALAIRLGEGAEALNAKKRGEIAPEPRSITSIRREYEEDYGSTIFQLIHHHKG